MSKQHKMQHYVPRFYLKNFSEKSRGQQIIHCFDKVPRKVFLAGLNKIAGENFFYDVERDQYQKVEEYLARLERLFRGPYSNLVDGKPPSSLTSRERSNMSVFVATQLMRTRESREGLEDLLRQTGDRIKSMGCVLDDTLKEELKIFSNKKLQKELHVNIIITEPPELGRILFGMKWILMSNHTNQPFWTSDHPVTRYNGIDMRPYGNLGLKCLGIRLYLPLSSKNTLCICDPISFILYPEMMKITDIKNVVHLNSLQVLESTRHIFSRDSNFDLALKIVEDNPDIGKIVRRRWTVQ